MGSHDSVTSAPADPSMASSPVSHLLPHALAGVALAGLACGLFLYRVGDRAAWSSHEGRAGQHAQLMIDSGQWGMPRLFGGLTDYQKPPMYYWLVALAAQATGGAVTEWSIRLPAALAASCGILLVYGFGAVIWRPATGFVAALVLTGMLRYAWLARVGRIDMPFTLAVSLSLLCFFLVMTRAHTAPRRLFILAVSYLALAAAVLLKGPVALVLTGLPVASYLAWSRFRSRLPAADAFDTAIGPELTADPSPPRSSGAALRSLGLTWGIPLVCLVAGPWYAWATVESDGRFLDTFFWHHHFDRALGTAGLKPEPIWYYVPRLAVDTFPWCLLLPLAAYGAWSRRGDPRESAGVFGLCWVASMFVFLSVVRFKRHDYLLPLMPGIAFLLAGYWDRLMVGRATVREWRWGKALGVLVVVASMVGAAAMLVGRHVVRSLFESDLLSRSLQETDRLMLEQLRAMAGDLRGGGLVWVVATGMLGAAAAMLMTARRVLPGVLCVVLACSGSVQFYVHRVLPCLEPLREQRSVAAAARTAAPAGATLYYYGRENPQLMYYLGSGARWLPNRDALRPVLTRSEPVFVLMEQERFEMRRSDWRDVTMVPLTNNTRNAFGTHHDPVVLVTNAAGHAHVRSGSGTGVVAN